MKKNWLISIIITSCVAVTTHAQVYKATGQGVKSEINAIEVEVQFYSPSIVRVLKYPASTGFVKQNLSVVKSPEEVSFITKQQGDELLVESKALNIVLNLKNGKVSFFNRSGIELLSEKDSCVVFSDFNDAGIKTYSVSQSFRLDKDEAIYGLGQQQHGKMSKRNVKLNMIQGNTDDYIPFFLSEKGYGLYWDNYSPTTFQDTLGITTFKSDVTSVHLNILRNNLFII